MQPRALGDRVVHRLARVERAVGILEDELDRAAVRLQRRRAVAAAAARRSAPAAGRLDQPDEHARERRLAAARLADQRDDLAAARPLRSSPSTARAGGAAAGAGKVTRRSSTSSSGGLIAVRSRAVAAARLRRVAEHPQAGRPPPGPGGSDSHSSISALVHSSMTTGQRGANGQPGSTRLASGGSPGSPAGASRDAGSPIFGNAAASARGVGVARVAHQLARGAVLDDLARRTSPPARRTSRRAPTGRG